MERQSEQPIEEPKTLRPSSMDYALAGIAPFFIIGMIGSLTFFLITVFYRGDYPARLMWILGLYTFAAVLIARIAIEQTRTYAMGYMVCLGLATLLVAPQFIAIQGPMSWLTLPLLVFFLVLIAFLADRITFDCTSINEADASSGVGLLQSLGINKSETFEKSKELQSRPGAYLKRRKKHNPGVWVLYFALMVLPLFGIGQFFIRDVSSRLFSHRLLFIYLFCTLSLLVLISLLSLRKYLRERSIDMEIPFAVRWLSMGIAAVFALLLVFALLPIPNQSMWSWDFPLTISSRDDLQANRFGWGNEGVADENAVPPKAQNGKQPDAPNGPEGNRADQQDDAGAKPGDGKANPKEQGGNEKGEQGGKGGQGKKGEQKTESGKEAQRNGNDQSNKQDSSSNGDQEKQGQQGNGDQQGKDVSQRKEEQKQNGKQPGNGEKKESNEQQGKAEQQKRGEPLNGEENPRDKEKQNPQQRDPQEAGQPQPEQVPPANQPTPTPQSSWSMQWNLGPIFQWLVVLALLIVAVVYGIKYRQAILNFFNQLLGRTTKDSPTESGPNEAKVADLFPPFLSFQNPFATRGMPTEQIVRQMFRAIQSWGYERRVVRSVEETPDEYVRRLGRRYPEQMQNLMSLGLLYGRIAYARGKVATQELAPLQELWQWLASQR